METLVIHQESTVGQLTLTLAGTIDERSDLSPLWAAQAGRLILDLGEVSRINSVGVRDWIRAGGRIPAAVDVVWRRVPEVLVTQMGMIANFAGAARVESFFTPWFCDACDWEGRFLQRAEALEEPPAAERHRCPTCGAALIFDDLEREYLAAVMGR